MKKISVALLLALSLAGCGYLIDSITYTKQYADPNRSFVVMYVRFDQESYGNWVHFRDAAGNDDESLMHVGDKYAENGACDLYAGTIASGSYELSAVSTSREVYKFGKDAAGNIKLEVRRPDIYFAGQYDLGIADEGGFLKKATFYFKKAKGCPSEKTALKTVLADHDFASLIQGTQWPAKLNRKIAGLR